ncbi:MLO-like protein 13 isoform X2 [Asparagus officinalis]|uniref:MLO-like protein 13 isoform X2 n=1 Tax=Asparagus officinalis TaxID=4686 RepID=UPI00098E1195|nr:MLO-like protein 13 isoform X2 [Asparagus officinalis]
MYERLQSLREIKLAERERERERERMVPSISTESSELKHTPTWVVATVCTIIIAISLLVERLLHYLGKFLKNKQNDSLFEALQKLKEELMLLGFISLLMTVFQNTTSHFCVSPSITSHMLPCKKEESLEMHIIKDLSLELGHSRRRLLSESDSSSFCLRQGKVPILSVEALHQLHIFIFVLAAVHVGFCASTMVLGGAKIRQWKHWEEAILKEKIEQEKNKHLTHAHTHHEFLMERKGLWRESRPVRWMMSFFKQFCASVTKSDYRALRSGFIMKHCSSNKNFDFHKYMMRALEDDFKVVVGISWYLWLFVIIFLLLKVYGWHTHFWLSFLPLILLLVVGTKLEYIITRLALDAAEGFGEDHQEIPRVKPSDHHFWFKHPGFVLYLIHFILFQNSFEIAFFFWIWSTYGFKSCIMDKVGFVIPRLVIGVIVQVLCSYSTLPLYAIVTQMGDTFKQAIFADQLRSTLHNWAENVRKRKKAGSASSSLLKKLNIFGSKSSEVQMQKIGSETTGSSQNDQRPAALKGVIASMVQKSETHDV